MLLHTRMDVALNLRFKLLHRVANFGPKIDVTPELVHCVCMAADSLVEARPRQILPWKKEKQVLLFTEGAVENDFSRKYLYLVQRCLKS